MPLILIVDDEEDIRWTLKRILRNGDYEFVEASSGAAALEIVQRLLPDLVILDMRMPGMDGFETMEKLRAIEQALPIIFLTGVDSVKGAVEAMKKGAADYLVKPVDHDELRLIVQKTLESSRLSRVVSLYRQQMTGGFVPSVSAKMRALDSLVQSIAARDVNVLLQGESGTGKQVIAERLHAFSPRSARPFITIDCGAVPESLMESEFFGYEKGAFTGANYRKLGRLEVAKGGTLFLDEIGNLPLNLQSKLLRVLESRQFERLGGNSSLLADFRLITATNSNLAEKVQTGDFRSDLYYRINVFTIDVPALREHREDIKEYVEYFIGVFNAKHGKSIGGASDECMKVLQNYTWPGNIRQLRNTIERAVLLSDRELLPEHLSDDVTGIGKGVGMFSTDAPENVRLHVLEERALRTALRKSNGDKTLAAAELGISLRTLYYWLKKYNISSRQTK